MSLIPSRAPSFCLKSGKQGPQPGLTYLPAAALLLWNLSFFTQYQKFQSPRRPLLPLASGIHPNPAPGSRPLQIPPVFLPALAFSVPVLLPGQGLFSQSPALAGLLVLSPAGPLLPALALARAEAFPPAPVLTFFLLPGFPAPAPDPSL